MKILLEKYPLLQKKNRMIELSSPVIEMALLMKLGNSNFGAEQKYIKDYRQFLKDLASIEDIKTYLIADTIARYLVNSGEKLMNKMWAFLHDLRDDTESIIWKDYTFFYRKFNDGNRAVIMYYLSHSHKNEQEMGIFTKEKLEDGMRGRTDDSIPSQIALMLTGLVLPFLEFAECETKIVNASHNKKTTLNKENYITDVNHNIEIVDSRWFTTLIHSDAFKVSGHFRLQPVGEGRRQRRMIWIKDFEKHGYKRKSKLS